jgi:hypothetical protein
MRKLGAMRFKEGSAIKPTGGSREKNTRPRLLQKVKGFRFAETFRQWQEDSADPVGGEMGYGQFRPVRRPDRDDVAMADANSLKGCREVFASPHHGSVGDRFSAIDNRSFCRIATGMVVDIIDD